MTPGISSAEFRAAMRCLAGAVNIITARSEDGRAGMTATAVCSVCAEPPTLLVCINRSAATHDAVVASGAFCVNVLRAEDYATSAAFGGAASLGTRFKGRQWLELESGSPVYADALCSFDCRVSGHTSQGTHSVFFGRITAIAFGGRGRPLVYADGNYASLVPLAHAQPLPEGADAWGFW